MIAYGKAAAADDATRSRVQLKDLAYWSEPASCESFRREWDLRNLVAENRARK